MKTDYVLLQCCFFLLISFGVNGYGQSSQAIQARHKVTLKEAHIGSEEIDSRLLDSYEMLPQNVRAFYIECRSLFESRHAGFTSREIVEAASNHQIALMGGPMLGKLREDGVSLWLRPASDKPLTIKTTKSEGGEQRSYVLDPVIAGKDQRIEISGLSPSSGYNYVVLSEDKQVAEGSFCTAPGVDEEGLFRLTFGSCFHKIGLHNPNLINAILKREPQAMLLLGDIAVDDRENRINMHYSDYLLRDLSKPWKELSANIPLYACWDDHDYLNNDLSGLPERFSEEDREALRTMWRQNWNNPENASEGIYFNTRMGPVEIIMLDTRSCRRNEARGKYGSYLGEEQLSWLKDILKNSTAPFKIISSGTMWSDNISNGKDSWGTWDTIAREEIFEWIETENITGVLLISGDRHGARGIKIPRASGFTLYEFEAASLGGVPGPDAFGADSTNQLFGYHGREAIAFGEFTFDLQGAESSVSFRLIDEKGHMLEEHVLGYGQLSPGNP